MNPRTSPDHRHQTDRRRRPTGPRDAFRLGGRRARPRRDRERREDHFTDRFGAGTFALVLLLLVLTIVDGALTLTLLGLGFEEANPAMRFLLRQGPVHFVLGKYALTAAGLPFLLIYRDFSLFGTRFRVGHLIPVFIALYIALLGYQVALIRADAPRPAGHTLVL